MVLMRGFAAIAAAAIIAAMPFGCGSGLSKSDADIRCNQEKVGKAACFDANAYLSCESCFMHCGDSCVPQSTCPSTYLCPGDTPDASTGGTGSTGTGM